MKKRTYHYFFDDNSKHQVKDKLPLENGKSLFYKNIEIDCFDEYPDELVLLALPIQYLHQIGNILEFKNLSNSSENFFNQCREVIAVSEKHQNKQGSEGKMNFQVYFHNFPASLESINDKAIVVVALAPSKIELDDNNNRFYKVACYLHANEFWFAKNQETKELVPAYYYNILRVSEEQINGKKIYRRSGVFSSVFGVLLDLTIQNDIHFAYATMGKENVKIKNALIKLANSYNKQYDFIPTKSHSKITFWYGNDKCKKELVDITNNQEQLEVLYHKNQKIRAKYMFNQYPRLEDFLHTYKKIISYSKTTKTFMRVDENGKMTAACIALSWGDYLSFVLENPKGFFRIVEKLKVTEKLVYGWFTVGDPKEVGKLYKGISKYYREQHGIKMLVMTSYAGDPYKKQKASLVHDPTNYFVIHDRPEEYQKLKEYSKDKNGNARIYVDAPLM